MAIFYFDHRTHAKTATRASQVVAYLQREGEYAPKVKEIDYLDRTAAHVAERDDLRHTEVAHFPAWTNNNPTTFFAASQEHERRNGRWATALQAALPRELSREQQLTLSREFIATVLANHPTLWVMHEPTAKDGGLQPHIHVLFSERTCDEFDRSPKQFFSRYNPKHPERGGAQKDRFFSQRRALDRMRDAWADLANYHLELAGSEARIDARSLKKQERSATSQWWDKRKAGYDLTSSDFPEQVVARMRSGKPGKQLSAEELQIRKTALEQYHRELSQGIQRFQLREYPDSPLRPTEEKQIHTLLSKGIQLGIGEGDYVHKGAQISKSKEKDYGYDL